MQINSTTNQPVITGKTEFKTNEKQVNNDTVSLGRSGTKMDDILNYKNLAVQFEKNKTSIETGLGTEAGTGKLLTPEELLQWPYPW